MTMSRPSSASRQAEKDKPLMITVARTGAGRGEEDHAHTPDIDRHVGMRIRERRITLGLTQRRVAQLIGVTYQQAQKYEKGVNGIAAEQLFTLAQALGVSIDYFFEGVDRCRRRSRPQRHMPLALARGFAAMSRPYQEVVGNLARRLAGGGPAKDGTPDGHVATER
jgi:transcriptional regulator with XRE-family HTH domain